MSSFTGIIDIAALSARMRTANWIDPVQPARRADYDAARQRYLDQVPSSSLLSVYQIGEIGVPGLSDIDLLLVFRDDCPDLIARYSIQRLEPFDRYLFLHNPWMLDRNTFERLLDWFPVFKLVHVNGVALTPAPHAGDEGFSAALLLTQFILTKVPSDFLIYSVLNNTFHERVMIGMVNSLRHSLNLWRTTGEHLTENERAFFDRVESLRNDWFSTPEKERCDHLVALASEAVAISLELIAKLDGHLTARYFCDARSGDPADAILDVGFRRLRFTRAWTPDKALANALDSRGREFLFPYSLLYLPAAFLSSEGPVGRHMRTCLQISGAVARTGSETADRLDTFRLVTEAYAEFHQKKFRSPLPGYHSFWCGARAVGFPAYRDKAINRLAAAWYRRR